MSVTDFFRLIIRLFGLYSLVMWTNSLIGYSWSYVADGGLEAIALGVGMTAMYFAFSMVLIFKADTLIRWMKLDKGFEGSQIAFDKLTAKTIIQIGTVLIGGYLFIFAVSNVVGNIYYYIQASASNAQDIPTTIFKGDEWAKQQLALDALDLLIGFLLITNADRVGRWLSPKAETGNGE